MERFVAGLTLSPFVLRAVIKEFLEENESTRPIAAKLIEKQLYVDHLIGHATDDSTAVEIIKDVREIFTTAGINMRKWVTNDQYLGSRL